MNFSQEKRDALPIRKILHRIWVGPNPISDWAWRWEDTWREHNPDWEFVWWHDEHVEPAFALLSRHLASGSPDSPDLAGAIETIYHESSNTGHRSDILRLVVLFIYGGVYVDADVESLQPLEPRLRPWLEELEDENQAAFVATYFDPRFCHGPYAESALMGASREHPFFDLCLRMLPQWFREHHEDSIMVRTGPTFVGHMLALWAQQTAPRHSVAFLPNEFLFHPRRWETQNLFGHDYEEPVPPDTVNVHHNAGTW